MRWPFPDPGSPLVNKTGNMLSPWIQYFQQWAQNPTPFVTVPPTASPMTYTAVNDGHVSVIGGTVSNISLIRGGVTLSLGNTSQVVPVIMGDQVKITYTVAPTITYIPE